MSFDPNKPGSNLSLLPPEINLEDKSLKILIKKGKFKFKKLNKKTNSLPNPMILLSLIIMKEVHASLDVDDVSGTMGQILSYRDAFMWGYANYDKYNNIQPFSEHICSRITHGSIRNFRRRQNRIISSNSKGVVYTPPLADEIPKFINNLDQFNQNKEIDPLVRIIISHYQFYAIHPFMEANGRTCRILFILDLLRENFIKFPILFFSGYLRRNRKKYFSVIQGVDEKRDWKKYLIFMLDLCSEQAEETVDLVDKINKVHKSVQGKIDKRFKDPLAARLGLLIVGTPVLNRKIIQDHFNCSDKIADQIIRELLQLRVGKSLRLKGQEEIVFNSEIIEFFGNVLH